VKEAVDNALDACEEAGILPELRVEVFDEEDGELRVAFITGFDIVEPSPRLSRR